MATKAYVASEEVFYSEHEVIAISEYAENQVQDAHIKRTLLKLPNILSKLRKTFVLIQQESETIGIDTEILLNKFSRQAFSYKVRIRELEAENAYLRKRSSMNILPQKPPPASTTHQPSFVTCDCPPGDNCHPARQKTN